MNQFDSLEIHPLRLSFSISCLIISAFRSWWTSATTYFYGFSVHDWYSLVGHYPAAWLDLNLERWTGTVPSHRYSRLSASCHRGEFCREHPFKYLCVPCCSCWAKLFDLGGTMCSICPMNSLILHRRLFFALIQNQRDLLLDLCYLCLPSANFHLLVHFWNPLLTRPPDFVCLNHLFSSRSANFRVGSSVWVWRESANGHLTYEHRPYIVSWSSRPHWNYVFHLWHQ